MRTLVVGDIHGGFKALEQVISKIDVRKNDRFIFVGDYVDGWSESVEVIDFLIEFSEKTECIFLRGNHDELLFKYLKHGDDNEMWLAHGGESSKKPYDALSEEKKNIHINFLENLRNYFVDEENRLFLHAGFTNLHGPEHEYHANTVYWDRTLWEMVCGLDENLNENDDKYPKRLRLFKEIYIGHTPVTRIGFTKPVNFANVWNVDTGAAFKGPISVLDSENKKIWQSEPVWHLYPEEKGRN